MKLTRAYFWKTRVHIVQNPTYIRINIIFHETRSPIEYNMGTYLHESVLYCIYLSIIIIYSKGYTYVLHSNSPVFNNNRKEQVQYKYEGARYLHANVWTLSWLLYRWVYIYIESAILSTGYVEMLYMYIGIYLHIYYIKIKMVLQTSQSRFIYAINRVGNYTYINNIIYSIEEWIEINWDVWIWRW